MTMVTYNWTINEGNPVLYKNGMFIRKSSNENEEMMHSCDEGPMSSEEMKDVITADGNYRFMFAINNQFPAPTLTVYENQRVRIHVHNDLVNEAFTLHWHGLSQNGTVWMDGVSMVTQCPILPGQKFTYLFTASPRGTHWYHAHHGTMRSSGLAGAFIVLPRKEKERTDIPKTDKDVVLMVQDWSFPESDVQLVMYEEWYMQTLRFVKNMNKDECLEAKLSYDGSHSSMTMPYSNTLVNGKTKYFSSDSSDQQRALPLEIFNITPNSYTRFRLINSALSGEYKISFDKHKLLLVGTDGAEITPVWIDFLIINGGESYDVILHAYRTPDNYWIRIETTDVMDVHFNPVKPNISFAQLHYQGADDKLPESEERECSKLEPCVMANCHWSPVAMAKREPNTKCLSVADLKATSRSIEETPVAVPTSRDDFQEIFLNFNPIGTKVKRVRPAVNSIHYKHPPIPLQIYPDIVKDKSIVCDNEHMDICGEFCRCTHVIKLATKKTTQIVLLAEAVLGTFHPIHLHGNRFHVLKYGYPVMNETTGLMVDTNQDVEYSQDFSKAKWRNQSWKYGNVPDINIKNPPQKDTVVVPGKGYVVLRLKTDNPGFWFVHCHIDNHMTIGMAVVLQVGEPDEMPKLPTGFPRCSNSKFNPDVESKSKFDQEDGNFLKMSAVDGTTNIVHAEQGNYSENHGVFVIKYTTYTTLVAFLVIFVFGFLVLCIVFFSKNCNQKCFSSRPQGYNPIESEQTLIYPK
ncbi:uncharacterized protein LOC133202090 isoform X2 [Saccostrea echinata]|nr:uncharacterized protein LOC133202090 isoform X2 [Saccostrea echinata]XP_061193855.1 uncharacterized protein LOC133202090 isoform X2 [Saccostrea echinata]